ncbi:hypothetical protein [Sphingomonas jatrophae]|uniref:Uncharacterized protein n=1 Tax=Sphingomonas jatrophae TaxID=1166337 RepID=A0A1I6JPB3_9SPHN|nr:hypothetical protein [Sphingomonas jatrophae]SFR80817.1 hypothetical protein SAMN05192580_0625 [Sphingomonas jatrophae]
MDIPWDNEASLMRVVPFETAEPMEELVARGTLHELVGQVLEMPADAQRNLLLRASGPDWTEEYDSQTIRELAARPEYTSAHGAFDTADLPRDQRPPETGPDHGLSSGQVGGPTGVHPNT